MNGGVLLLIRSLNTGGTERQLSVLAMALRDRGVRVTVATFYDGGELAAELRQAGVVVESLAKRGRWEVAGFAWRLVSLLRSRQPAVLYCFLPSANMLGALLRPLTRVPRVVWGIRASSIDYSYYDRFARIEARFAPSIARLADAVICNSEAGKQLCIRQGYDSDALFVVPNGIDTQRFRFDAAGRNRLRGQWGIRDDELLVGVVARLDPMKDHSTFLRAAKELAGEHPRSRFVCVGSGSKRYAAMLRSLSAELGLDRQLRWVDEADDVASTHSALDVLCSSSRMGEGFSNSIAEAMACERVCVATDVGDARRIVGDTGQVVAAADHAALASACLGVARLAPMQRALLGANARQRVQEHFSVERLVEDTRAVLGV